MDKMLTASTAFRGVEIKKKLDYLKKHSSKETYDKVAKSFHKTELIIIVICIISVIIQSIEFDYFNKKINSKINENNISFSYEKTGHVLSGVLYYIDNEKYEIDMSEYGYDINDYEDRTDFRIYLDENHNVVDIIPVNKNEITITEKFANWTVGHIIFFVIVMLIFYFWSRKTMNKEWIKYCNWLKTKADNEEWYNG
jgi:hypothetical protein